MKVLAGLVPPETSLLSWQMAALSLSHATSSRCRGASGVSPSSYKDTTHAESGPHLSGLM